MTQESRPSKEARIAAKAERYQEQMAGWDRDERLQALRNIQTSQEDAEAQRKALIALEVPLITEDGVYFFLDEQGNKIKATLGKQDSTVYDAELLADLVPEEVYEEVVEHNDKVVPEKFLQAAQAGRIPPEVLVKVVSVVAKSRYVRLDEA